MVWSVGLFTLVYLLQVPFFMAIGIRNTATVLLVLLIVSAIFAGYSIYVLYQREHEGMTAFGIITMFLAVVLILTRYEYVGIFLFVLYSISTISHLFKFAQRERVEAAKAATEASAKAAKKTVEPPADLPL